ncbi:TlpA family protein disulfide reductase [Runella zeae]|uniref:TlpA family protein disulfide reductase n=1 Tax=Runella zeae TaxID=94255 RepID=UPI000427FF77|nr:TlpA disulfide reductase family protein [Runella zeae]
MNRYAICWVFCLVAIIYSYGQEQHNTLNGKFEQIAAGKGRKVILLGYEGKLPKSIDTVRVDNDGRFSLRYPQHYRGMGLIQVQGAQGEIPVVLTTTGASPQQFTLTANGNLMFADNSPNARYYTYQQSSNSYTTRLEQIGKLSKYYQPASVFGAALAEEQKNVEQARLGFLTGLDTLSGDVGYFLRLQESLTAMNVLLGSEIQPPLQKLQAAQKQFEKVVHFDDERLWHSNILHRLVYSYYSLSSVLEGGHRHAGDFLAERLANSPYKTTYIEEIIGVLQGQTEMAEYFSQKMLAANEQCDDIKGNDIPGKIKRQLEQYSLLKVGNPAPDELLENGKRISELSGAYKLIVFWASWCEHCQKELPELRTMYADLKKQDIEVVAMGMDDNADIHRIVSQPNPWISHFVGRDWNAPVTQHYRVFGTPTFFLVDKEMNIVAKPKSVAEVNQWLNRNKI